MLDEKNSKVSDRKVILVARCNDNFIHGNFLLKVDKAIEEYKEKIEQDDEWREAIASFQKVKNIENCVYFFHYNIYADIPIKKGFEIIGLLNEDWSIDYKSIVFSEIEILAYIDKFKYFPWKHASHGHSGFCLAHFSNGIPDIVNQLFEIKEEKTIDIGKTLFLCARETLQFINIENLIWSKLKQISILLANKEYSSLDAYLESGVNISDFLIWLRDYCVRPGHEKVVTIPPREAFYEIDIIERTRNKKAIREFHVLFDLWIDGEKSDLTLECEVEYYSDNDIRFYMHDLHVM